VLRDVRLTDRDVILARTNLPDSKLRRSNEQMGNFVKYASFPLPLLRGWGSVDVTLRGQTIRFINTHLEPESTDPAVNVIQVAQGNEILSGPANTYLPVILVGDFNSRADGSGTPTCYPEGRSPNKQPWPLLSALIHPTA
jgi:endonuclease/exonuclease/phosphatase family metal-dependent hydrolase